ncbi:MAG TPA: hypothetical protein PLL78_00140 [Fimbriimonadaceae bacterium]|nr:hypothetical protein [Fimbriimonadaceae bacterium]HRJ95069.1 hypothetical protein [Fimbriimonadaceae bacterium]
MTEGELRRKVAALEAERDDLARQLAGIRDQFAAVKRAYLTKKAGVEVSDADKRISELEALVARLEQENKNLKKQLVEALRKGAPPKAAGKQKAEADAAPEPAEEETLDPRAILKRQLEES